MLLILPVCPRHIVAARSHELFHERIERSHLRGRVRQLVRHDGRYRRALEVASHRFEQQAAVLRYLGRHQFPCTFDLVKVLHRTLRIGEIFQHLVLHAVYPVEGDSHGGFGGDNLLLRLSALVVQALQFQRLCRHRACQSRVYLLGECRDGIASGQPQDKCPSSYFQSDCFHIRSMLHYILRLPFLRSARFRSRSSLHGARTGASGLFKRQSFQSLNDLGGNHCPVR